MAAYETDGTAPAYEAPKVTVWGSVADLTAGPLQDGLADLPLAGHRLS